VAHGRLSGRVNSPLRSRKEGQNLENGPGNSAFEDEHERAILATVLDQKAKRPANSEPDSLTLDSVVGHTKAKQALRESVILPSLRYIHNHFHQEDHKTTLRSIIAIAELLNI